MVGEILDFERSCATEGCWKKCWSSGSIMLTSILILLAPSSYQGSVGIYSPKHCFIMSLPVQKQSNDHSFLSKPSRSPAKWRKSLVDSYSFAAPFAPGVSSVSFRASTNGGDFEVSQASAGNPNTEQLTNESLEHSKENTYSWLLEKTKGRTAQFDLIFKRSSNRIEYQRRYLELRAKVLMISLGLCLMNFS